MHINEHKAMIITDCMCQTNEKLFAAFNPKDTSKLEFADYLWLPFLDQPQSDVVLLSSSIFDLYKSHVTYWKYEISTNYKITFNETLINLSTEIVELKILTSFHMNRQL